MNKTLFLFSKTFPFGHGEQYIENELPFLAKQFEKVIIYPSDWFEKETAHNKKLPANIEVLNFNPQLKKTSGNFLPALKLTVSELSHSPNLSKEIRRPKYLLNIAKHQIHTAKNFGAFIEANYKGKEVFFYTYWSHHATIMLAILKMKGIIQKFVTRGHSVDLYGHDWAIASSLKVPSFEYTRFKYADHIYTVSRHGKEFFSNKFKVWKDKVSYAYLGISDNGVNETRGDVFTIVTCSNLTANKRMTELAKAIRELKFPVQWVHFGDGEQRDGIEKISASLAADKKITLMGNTPNEEVRKYLTSKPVDLFVNLSIVEGLPVSIMEAISAGIPVIATSVYGTPEIVTENTGLTIPVQFTTQNLVDAIHRLHSDTNLKKKLSAGARQHYLANFNDSSNYTAFAKDLLNYPNKIN